MFAIALRKWWWVHAILLVNFALAVWFLSSGPLRRGGPWRRNVIFRGTGTLSGRITENGRPITRGRASLLPEQSRDKFHFRNDSSRIACEIRDGSYKLTGVMPGGYQIRLETDERIVLLPRVQVAPGEQVNDISLPAPHKTEAKAPQARQPAAKRP